MEMPYVFPLGEGLELTQMERNEEKLILHVRATPSSVLCPLCAQPATRLHSRYRRVVKDLPCTGQRVQLILYVRTFFCDTVTCARKVFAERLSHLVAPWAQMTTRLSEVFFSTNAASTLPLFARGISRLFAFGCNHSKFHSRNCLQSHKSLPASQRQAHESSLVTEASLSKLLLHPHPFIVRNRMIYSAITSLSSSSAK
jgi:transposase